MRRDVCGIGATYDLQGLWGLCGIEGGCGMMGMTAPRARAPCARVTTSLTLQYTELGQLVLFISLAPATASDCQRDNAKMHAPGPQTHTLYMCSDALGFRCSFVLFFVLLGIFFYFRFGLGLRS